MDVATFTQQFPALYHLTFAQNIPGIERHGLQSPAALADLHDFTPEEREATLTTRRRCIQDLHNLSLRDQHTAPEARMKSCLVRITIPDWLALLNSKIFFFLSQEKALRLAEGYADYKSVLLEVDTAALLASHAPHATLCKLSSGDFLHNPRPRGRDSFIPVADYAYKKSRDTPAELTIDVPIPHILQIATIVPVA
ncbi:DUF7002 family protein [Granulicella arctica]|uniref:DUF7002 family protein n=1 Tax=Granulicella arctica TaxID=940613 RepID=UPI0021E01978|nr:hypothetical protein [Granulicella arctica]